MPNFFQFNKISYLYKKRRSFLTYAKSRSKGNIVGTRVSNLLMKVRESWPSKKVSREVRFTSRGGLAYATATNRIDERQQFLGGHSNDCPLISDRNIIIFAFKGIDRFSSANLYLRHCYRQVRRYLVTPLRALQH